MNQVRQEIHERALKRCKDYLKSEVELLESIQEVDEHKIYLDYQCRNLHVYVSSLMGLGDAVASNFITVARKAKEVPALREVIKSGKLQVQKARKITPVLNHDNQEFWLKLAVEQPQKVIEKEVAREKPDLAKPERVKYISEKRLNVSLNISEETHFLLQRAQDLESQRLKKAAKLEDVLGAGLRAYLEKYDPLEKAKRAAARKDKSGLVARDTELNVSRHIESEKITQKKGEISKHTKSARPARPTSLEHQRHLRDQGQCTHMDQDGMRCKERRWLQGHHVTAVSEGGQDTIENMTTLCFGHHRLVHQKNHFSDQARQYLRSGPRLRPHPLPRNSKTSLQV
jgi:hypothetical protein